MSKSLQKSSKKHIEILKVLSEEIRIRLLILLESHELMVGEIQEIITVKQSNLSSHLNILHQHGLVMKRREGQKIFYRLSIAENKPIQNLIKKILETSKDLFPFSQDQEKVLEVIENRKEASRLFFNKKENNQVIPGQLPEALLLGFIRLIPPTSIIDMGCGKGNLCRLLAEAGHIVYGIDHSHKQIKEARQQNLVNDEGKTHYRVNDMEKTDFQDGFFTLAFLCHSLHHTANPQIVLREVFRILNKEGQLFIFDLDHHQDHKMEKKFGDFWMGFRNDKLLEWLISIGFQIRLNRVISETLYPIKKKIVQPVKPLIIIAQKKQ